MVGRERPCYAVGGFSWQRRRLLVLFQRAGRGSRGRLSVGTTRDVLLAEIPNNWKYFFPFEPALSLLV